MNNFSDWLPGTIHTDPDIQKLAEYSKKNSTLWKSVNTQTEANSAVHEDATLSKEEKYDLLIAIDKALSAFELLASPAPGNAAPKPIKVRRWLTEFLANNAPILIIGVLAIGLIGFLVRAILDDAFLKLLSDITVARGLITFFFSLGTVGVAIILVTAVFTSDGDELKEKFDMGKQVLTTLIGVLGTIVGFYFGAELGQRSDTNGNNQDKGVMSSDSAVAGKISIISTRTGSETDADSSQSNDSNSQVPKTSNSTE
ncbi:MAG: hypothetical protein ABJM26_20540 [Anderseniella sp.]